MAVRAFGPIRIRCILVLSFTAAGFTETHGLCAADFDQDVAPLLIRKCLECHRSRQPSGGLSLETADGLTAGGDSGPVVDSNQPDDSLLLQRVHDGEMPPPVRGVPQNLSQAEINILRQWIVSGADWPDQRSLDLYEITSDVRGGRDWWSFQPVLRPAVPQSRQREGSANAIDAFILQRLARHQLQPAPQAAARALVRRLFVSVIGLPPSGEQFEFWTSRIRADGSAVELVEHLLNSPHFGERWARHWLDLVRYADTSGYERDQPKPFAWKYRDWVVRAINEDMPYDQFIREQLAGDEIPDRTESSVIATGFLRLGTWNDEPNDNADYVYERLEDLVHVSSSAFLGLTVKCARCHDHKFDPIPQEDYYRVASVFWPGPVAARDRKLLGGPSAAELGFRDVLGWTDLTSAPSPLHLLKNGERDKPLHPVVPASLSFSASLFRKFALPEQDAATTGRRLQLADWIASEFNPLTARVFVNRIWLHHFGQGLVRTANNFGFRGDRPTHPELLDWLASELIEHDWSAKHIHRLILNSHTWQQASTHPQESVYEQQDSGNHLWWKSNRRRLDAESLRDALLASSGELDLSIGGAGFKPTISAEALEGFSRKGAAWQASPSAEQNRRSLYSFVSRSLMPPMMTTFDQCDTTLPCAQRDVTTVAPQALAMLNNSFVHDRSDALADALAGKQQSSEEQIRSIWRAVLGREPDAHEFRLSAEHVERQVFRFRNPNPESNAIKVPTPVLHLRADSRVEKGPAGNVLSWHSDSDSLRAEQTDAERQPIFVPDAINGQPAIGFDGQRRFLRISEELLTSEYCTIIAIGTDRAQQPRYREILSNWNRGRNVTTSIFLGLKDRNTVRFSDQYSNAGQIIKPGQPFLLSAVNGPAGAQVWQNSTLRAERLTPLTGRRLGTEWVIGQQGNIDGEYWNGLIAEIIVFDNPLSVPQLATVWRELSDRYGLVFSEPASNRQRDARHLALASLCHVLFNSNEFLYVD